MVTSSNDSSIGPSTPGLDEHIPKSAKIAYGFANGGNGILSGLGLGSINLFYLKVTGMDPNLMAISWLLFAAWNAINDPLIGIIEDKTKSELGRRVPYLRYGSFIYAITFLLIWFPFSTVPTLLFINHFMMLFIFDTLYSMIGLITYSLPAEMALTAKERSSIVIYSTFIGAIGIVTSMLLPIIYLGDSPNILGFRIAMGICALAAWAMLYFSSYYIKENRYTQLEESLGFVDSIKMSLKNKPFLILEIGIFAMTIMQNILTSYLVFITDYLIDFNLSSIVNILVLIVLIGILVYFIFKITSLIQKYGLRKMFIFGSLIGILGFVILLVMGLILKPTAHNKVSLITGALPLLLIIFGMFVHMLTNQPLMADAIDNDELITGKRREASYSGVNALFTKPAVSIGHAVFLWVIKAYGYKNTVDPDTGTTPPPLDQPESVAMGVVLAFTVVPIICITIGILSMKYFPLDGPEWMKKKIYIQQIHQQKELAYIEHLRKEGKI